MKTALRQDYTEEALARRQAKAKRAMKLAFGRRRRDVEDMPLPPTVCQYRVAEVRRAFSREVLDALNQDNASPRRLWMLTSVHPDWAVDLDELNPTVLRRVREWVYRRALRDPSIIACAGAIDLSWHIHANQYRFWQPHLHVVVAHKSADPEEAKRSLRRLFRPPKDERLRVLTSFRARQITDLHGAVEYCTKTLLIDGPVQTSSWISRTSGRSVRRNFRLQGGPLIVLTRLLCLTDYEDRLIRFGLSDIST
jgi:hypothetical protein